MDNDIIRIGQKPKGFIDKAIEALKKEVNDPTTDSQLLNKLIEIHSTLVYIAELEGRLTEAKVPFYKTKSFTSSASVQYFPTLGSSDTPLISPPSGHYAIIEGIILTSLYGPSQVNIGFADSVFPFYEVNGIVQITGPIVLRANFDSTVSYKQSYTNVNSLFNLVIWGYYVDERKRQI